VQRLQAMRAVEVEETFGGTEDRKSPVALARVCDEARDEVARLAGRADRITRDDRNATDDAVAEERVAVLGEEVRLVRAEGERGERVAPPPPDELLRALAVVLLLSAPVTPGREPPAHDPCGRAEAEQEHGERKPAPEIAGEVRRAEDVQAEKPAQGLAPGECE